MLNLLNKTNKELLNKKILGVFAALSSFILALALSSCGQGDADKNAAPDAPKFWPLTHILATDVADRPAVSVKIENDPDARPQTGLQDADIVWETMIEGGVTRFIAVFNSKMPKTVGPVRSLRIADGPIVSPMNGLIVFSGSNGQRFQQVARDAGTQTIEEDAGAKGFFREGLNAPHNDYYTLQDALDQADNEHKKAPNSQFLYTQTDQPSTAELVGVSATKMTDVMSGMFTTKWEYDAKDKTYKRFQDDSPFIDKLTNKQITAKNVIALEMGTKGTPEIDPAGHPEMEMEAVGKGDGKIMVGGKILDIKWEKKDAKTLLSFTTLDGKEVLLSPGNTWIVLVPKNDGGSISYK
ncbi:MAG: DUF3048 domain-containing protein [Bifidobacteriaceae bacterium]|jgi:hypothetical protein|nr:DUF3048 domain-containing protein [Bifidobacteriaceae bacterium]